MFDKIGPIQLVIILVIVIMIFGVGKLPQAAGSLGKAIKEFKKESSNNDDAEAEEEEVEEVAPRKKRATTTRKAKTTKAVKAKETEV